MRPVCRYFDQLTPDEQARFQLQMQQERLEKQRQEAAEVAAAHAAKATTQSDGPTIVKKADETQDDKEPEQVVGEEFDVVADLDAARTAGPGAKKAVGWRRSASGTRLVLDYGDEEKSNHSSEYVSCTGALCKPSNGLGRC